MAPVTEVASGVISLLELRTLPAAEVRRGVHGWIVSVLAPGDELTRWEVHAVQLDVVLNQSAMTTTADRFLALVVEFGSEDGG